MSDPTIPGNDWEQCAVHNLRQAAQAQIGYLDSKPKAALLGAEAQTNAILALAYEQRTANLIALAQFEREPINPDYDMETIYNRLGLGDASD